MTVAVVTDSTSDLSDEALEREGIDMVPLTVHFGTEEYVDRRGPPKRWPTGSPSRSWAPRRCRWPSEWWPSRRLHGVAYRLSP